MPWNFSGVWKYGQSNLFNRKLRKLVLKFERPKKRSFYGQADCKGRGDSPLGPDHKKIHLSKKGLKHVMPFFVFFWCVFDIIF